MQGYLVVLLSEARSLAKALLESIGTPGFVRKFGLRIALCFGQWPLGQAFLPLVKRMVKASHCAHASMIQNVLRKDL